MKSLVFTSLYPNSTNSSHGVFVERRNIALNFFCTSHVVAPVSYLNNYNDLAFIPYRDVRNNINIEYPRFLNIPKIAKFLDGSLMYNFTKSSVDRIASSFKPDYIDANYAYPDGYAAMLHAHDLGIPFFLTVRGSDLHVLAKCRYRKKHIKRVLRSAAGIVAVSEQLAELAISLGASAGAVRVIANGVDPNQFRYDAKAGLALRAQLGIPAEAIVLLSVGRFVPLKRFELLIDILNHSHDRVSNRPLYAVIIGNGPLRAALIEKVRSSNLDEHVFFPGKVAPSDLFRWYSMADQVFVLSTHEGSPNVPLESLSCGTPVLATPVGDLTELITDGVNGALLASTEINYLLDKCLEVGGMEEGRREVVCQTVKHRTWKEVALKQYHFYCNVMEKTK